MSELTTQQKARIFAMYLGQDCIYNGTEMPVFSPNFCATQDAKLLLRPLSAITDEDAIEVAKIVFGADKSFHTLENGRWAIQTGAGSIGVQFLIQRGYAVPLFIAPNHPDNGKTAIELGLAIDSTIPHD